jgi:hypothetical protein
MQSKIVCLPLINGLKIVLTFHPLPTLLHQGGGTNIIPSPLEGEGKGEGDSLCLYYYETANMFFLACSRFVPEDIIFRYS